MAILPVNNLSPLGPQGPQGPQEAPWQLLKDPNQVDYKPASGTLDPSQSLPNIFANDPSLVSRTATVDPTDSQSNPSSTDPTQTNAPAAPAPQQQPEQSPQPVAPMSSGVARSATPLFANLQAAMQNKQSQGSAALENTPFSGLGNLTTKYGEKTKDENAHEGIDIANAKGTPIPAAAPGIVTKVEGQNSAGNPGYGNNVIIRDANGNFHRYSHLTGSYVKVGQPVKQGQTVGGMGDSGNAYSPSGGDASHLDYRLQSAYGQYMNPLKYFKRFRQQSV